MAEALDTGIWPAGSVETLCAMLAKGATGTAIADALGIGRGAVRGKIARMELEGDPRLPAQRPRRGAQVQRTTVELMDALADLMADGVDTIAGAGRLLGLTQRRADQLWQRIRRDLGPQAR